LATDQTIETLSLRGHAQCLNPDQSDNRLLALLCSAAIVRGDRPLSWTSSRFEHVIRRHFGELSVWLSLSNQKKEKSMKNAPVWYLLGLLSLGGAAWSQGGETGGKL
jgi:hypothetical protein